VAVCPPYDVLSDVAHELGLEFLGAQLTANVQGALFLGDLFVPRAQIQNWNTQVCE